MNELMSNVFDAPQTIRPRRTLRHYFGHTVRRLLISASVVILMLLPLRPELVPGVPIGYMLFGILAMCYFAAMTNPRQRGPLISDILIAASCFVLFGFVAVSRFFLDPAWLFVVRSALGIVFLCIFYFSAKSLRGLSPYARYDVQPLDTFTYAHQQSNHVDSPRRLTGGYRLWPHLVQDR